MSDVRKKMLSGILLCLTGVLIAVILFQKKNHYQSVSGLGVQLEEARKREEKAVMVRSVSKQMEEIAYQQKEISDRQRKEAELQATENYRMKLRVEEEWKRAVKAQEEAVKAYQLADRQKALAEERQLQAEYAKRVADTLTYLTLGRSLGSLSITQYKAGNYEVASLLAYASWNFVERFRGDTFLSSVFNALSLSSGQPSVWQKHKGGITSIIVPIKTGSDAPLYTVSKYGEILVWKKDGRGTYNAKVLFADSQYDFRAACADADGVLYALSFNGKILKLSNGQFNILTTEGKGYVRMFIRDGKILLLSDTGEVTYPDNKQVYGTPPDVTCMVQTSRGLYLGCKNGDVHLMASTGKGEEIPGNFYHAAVTAFGYCPENGQLAIGYDDGTLLLTGSDGKVIQRLVAHRSAISGISIRQNKLYSCSYDRTICLWNLETERQEAVTILESSSWLQAMEFSLDGIHLFAGDGNGNLYQLSVSPEDMADFVQRRLSRNFTPEEWVYYMGNQIPFETYTLK